MSHCIRCRVTGRVQGVWFRASTRQRAEQLGLSGTVRNLSDGSVEVEACGEEGAVAALHEWLWQGPELAQVSDVRCEPLVQAPISGFSIA